MIHDYTIRASSWAALLDCAYKFEWEQLLGKKKPSGPRALLGSAFHLGTAVFDTGRMIRSPVTIDEATGAIVDAIEHPEQPVDWRADTLNKRDVTRIAVGLGVSYMNTWSPKFEFEAVEFPLQEPIVIDVGNVRIRLKGTLDRMRAVRGPAVIDALTEEVIEPPKGRKLLDLKSGARIIENGAVKVRGFHAQLGSYELLYEDATGLPMTEAPGIIGASTTTGVIATADAPGAKQMLLGTDDTPGLLERSAAILREGLFPPNPNSPLCSPKYCSRWDNCIFHG